ncbi:hypothetical protein ACFOVU_16540 [Nocardiopsis sediminis]|uniref:Peptidase inhibitor family I36 protein n=1 Tax=Nocardiopsis sediminis TaxID=1778267 RepID=A0ABV8FR55_9ACTN
MRKIAKAAVLMFAVGAFTTIGAAGASAAQTADTRGCPSGAVCVYPQDAGWNNDRPELVLYTYGAHNLTNMVGQHYVFNNQTGGATARTCTGYNGTGCEGFLSPNSYIDKNMTPINSIVLVRP